MSYEAFRPTCPTCMKRCPAGSTYCPEDGTYLLWDPPDGRKKPNPNKPKSKRNGVRAW